MAIEALEGVTDQDLFNEANADEAPADEAVVEPAEEVVEQSEQPRDEAGRFAEKAADEPEKPVVAEAAQVDTVDDKATVPSFRLREETEARRRVETDLANERAERAALRQRLEALERPAPKVEEAKAEKPDPILDPVGFAAALRDEIREEMLADRREASLQNAHKTYKTEFEEAYAAAQKNLDPVLKMKMQTSRDPGETLIEWHREQKTRAEVGNDPNAFFQKRLDAWLADPANQAKVIEKARGGAQQQLQPGAKPAPAVSLPPSLTRAASAATITADDDDVSDDGLWKHANA